MWLVRLKREGEQGGYMSHGKKGIVSLCHVGYNSLG